MKKIIGVLTLLGTLLFASPAFAYTVTKGDSMSKIALEHGMTLKELASANPQITNMDLIYPGQTVHVGQQHKGQSEAINIGKNVKSVSYTRKKEPIKSVKASQVASAEAEVHEKQGKTRAKSASDSQNSMKLTDAEVDLLARIVRAEAQSESFEGKVAVAEVVLNRVENKKFPDSVKGVIYAPGQFQPVKNGQINKPADEQSFKAVHAALANNGDSVNGAVFFYNPAIASNRWLDTRQTTVIIGNHVFKK
ncbi:cell wall hydrolase [Bacillus sp. FJAT-27251]|uniref:cell wall hydrolase n=1 Tax=Bacillus sp. FJAT-27251 TaxID=1684142 RepID=UPI0006A79822|nr:cell wall hydrolase [Bacillus sp. FJAT-27251]